MPRLKPHQRGRLLGLLEAGLSVTEVANRLGVARSVVRKWRARPNDLEDLQRSGRPRVTSANQDASILNKAITNRNLTGNNLIIYLIDVSFINVLFLFTFYSEMNLIPSSSLHLLIIMHLFLFYLSA